MNISLSVALVSLVAVGCALPQEATGSSGEELAITAQHPNPNPTMQGRLSISKLSPPPEGSGVVPSSCSMPPGWMASSASFDGSVTPLFATELNPLLTGRPPITVAASLGEDGQWSMRASATVQQGTLQIFPGDHPATVSGANMSASGFATTAPIESAWIAVIDATSTLVWIPIEDVAVQGSFVTGGCAYVSAVVDAFVPKTAGEVAIVTAEGQRTLAELLGAGSPAAGDEGWRVRLTFAASAAPIGL